jgi:hypothetical protein
LRGLAVDLEATAWGCIAAEEKVGGNVDRAEILSRNNSGDSPEQGAEPRVRDDILAAVAQVDGTRAVRETEGRWMCHKVKDNNLMPGRHLVRVEWLQMQGPTEAAA